MNVNFTYTYPDYVALNKAMEKHGRFAKLSIILLYFIIILNIIISAYFIFDTLFDGYSLNLLHFANAGLALILILIFFEYKPFYQRRYNKKQMIDGKEIQLAFSQEDMTVDMPAFNGVYRWEAIIRANEQPVHFLFWINKVQAYCVPKRGFSSSADIEEFKSLVARKVKNQELIK